MAFNTAKGLLDSVKPNTPYSRALDAIARNLAPLSSYARIRAWADDHRRKDAQGSCPLGEAPTVRGVLSQHLSTVLVLSVLLKSTLAPAVTPTSGTRAEPDAARPTSASSAGGTPSATRAETPSGPAAAFWASSAGATGAGGPSPVWASVTSVAEAFAITMEEDATPATGQPPAGVGHGTAGSEGTGGTAGTKTKLGTGSGAAGGTEGTKGMYHAMLTREPAGSVADRDDTDTIRATHAAAAPQAAPSTRPWVAAGAPERPASHTRRIRRSSVLASSGPVLASSSGGQCMR